MISLNLTEPVRWSKHNAGKLWQMPENVQLKVVVSFACLLSLCKTIKVIYWLFLGILMIKQPCNMNEQERILTSEAATRGVL